MLILSAWGPQHQFLNYTILDNPQCKQMYHSAANMAERTNTQDWYYKWKGKWKDGECQRTRTQGHSDIKQDTSQYQ